MKKIIIVMPVANEEETMADIIERLLRLPYAGLILYAVIDSYSHDNTENIIRSYEYTGKVKCIFNERSTGVISCYFYGFQQALDDGADYIIEMDGGGSHCPEEVPLFIESLDQGFDCVFGSRYLENGSIKNHPLYRRLLSKGGTLLSNFVLHTNISDMTSGFEGFQRRVLERFRFDQFLSKGHIYQTEMRYYCRNLNWTEVPINYIGGKSSIKAKSIVEALDVLLQVRTNEELVFLR